MLCIGVMAKCNPTDNKLISVAELPRQAIIKVPIEEGEGRDVPRHGGEVKDKKVYQ